MRGRSFSWGRVTVSVTQCLSLPEGERDQALQNAAQAREEIGGGSQPTRSRSAPSWAVSRRLSATLAVGGGLALEGLGLLAQAPERIAALAELIERLVVVAGGQPTEFAEGVSGDRGLRYTPNKRGQRGSSSFRDVQQDETRPDPL